MRSGNLGPLGLFHVGLTHRRLRQRPEMEKSPSLIRENRRGLLLPPPPDRNGVSKNNLAKEGFLAEKPAFPCLPLPTRCVLAESRIQSSSMVFAFRLELKQNRSYVGRCLIAGTRSPDAFWVDGSGAAQPPTGSPKGLLGGFCLCKA